MRAAVLLAAGGSRRFGRANKLFARLGGATLLERALAADAAAPVERVILVTGWQAPRVARAARRRLKAARIVRARDHGEGIAASLRAAASTLRPVDRELLLFAADMPLLPPGLAARLVRAGRATRAPIVRPVWREVPGHPVLLRGPALARLAAARGDAGLRVSGLPVARIAGGPGSILDIDTPAALRRARLCSGRFRGRRDGSARRA